MLQKLLIAFAQVKPDNIWKLVNEITQIIYSLCQEKEIIKNFSYLMHPILYQTYDIISIISKKVWSNDW